MGSSGGGSWFGSGNVFGDILKVVTAGGLTYEGGKVGLDGYAKELVGELNGTNAAREEANKAEKAAEAEHARRQQDWLNEQVARGKEDMMASMAAQAGRAIGGDKFAAGTKNTVKLGTNSNERDILGI